MAVFNIYMGGWSKIRWATVMAVVESVMMYSAPVRTLVWARQVNMRSSDAMSVSTQDSVLCWIQLLQVWEQLKYNTCCSSFRWNDMSLIWPEFSYVQMTIQNLDQEFPNRQAGRPMVKEIVRPTLCRAKKSCRSVPELETTNALHDLARDSLIQTLRTKHFPIHLRPTTTYTQQSPAGRNLRNARATPSTEITITRLGKINPTADLHHLSAITHTTQESWTPPRMSDPLAATRTMTMKRKIMSVVTKF